MKSLSLFLDTADRKETTPLHTAAKLGDVRIVEMLLESGSSISSRSSDGKTPLHYSVRILLLFLQHFGSESGGLICYIKSIKCTP